MKTAYFAGGCFWCITPDLRDVPGVSYVVSGYCGGDETSPCYDDVKHQRTGHRETIAVRYDETAVSFAQLLDCFLRHVDPFDGGGQFIDRGHSYTLAVYYSDEGEKSVTENALQELSSETGKQVMIAV